MVSFFPSSSRISDPIAVLFYAVFFQIDLCTHLWSVNQELLRTEPDYGWELMRLPANENIPLDAVEALRVGGHDVLRIREEFQNSGFLSSSRSKPPSQVSKSCFQLFSGRSLSSNRIVYFVSSPFSSSIVPSICSTRAFTSCKPRVSGFLKSMFSG